MAQDALIRIRAKVDGQAEVQALERQFKRTETQTQKLKQGFSGLAGVAARLGVTFAAFQGLRFSIIKAAELETQSRSLQVLTGNLESAKNIISELQEFAAVTPFTGSELIETAKRLKAFGVDTENLVDTVKRLGDVSGATGSDLGGIATAFGQIVAKGRLQGEELLQLQERGVALADVLKKEYELTGVEFSKALEQGRFSAEVVQFALEELTDVGGKYANGAISQSTTLAGKFSTLQDNIERIGRAIGQALTPALSGALDILNTLAARLGDVNLGLANTQNALANVAISLGFEQQGLDNLDSAVRSIDLGLVETEEDAAKVEGAINRISASLRRITSDPQAVERSYPQISGLVDQLDFLRNILKTVREEGFEAQETVQRIRPDLTDPKDPSNAAAKAAKERERLLKQVLEIELKLAEAQRKGRISAQDAVTSSANRLALLREEDPVKRIALEFDQKRAEAHERTVRAIEATDDPLQQQLANQKFFLDLEILSVEEQKALKAAAEETNSVFESMKDTIETGLNNAIMGLIDGTKTLGESLSGILRQMASLFLQAGIGSFKGSDGKGGSGLLGLFANGGVIAKNNVVPFAYGGIVNKPTLFPMANGAGLMGEAGPEAIMPLRRGPSGRLGVQASGGVGNVVVNVDASGSAVEGNDAEAAQLGKAIGIAVQQELIKQKRPGGLLAS